MNNVVFVIDDNHVNVDRKKNIWNEIKNKLINQRMKDKREKIFNT